MNEDEDDINEIDATRPSRRPACHKYGQVRKNLPLGCILREWKKGRLLETCPQCGGPLYVYRSFAQFLEGIEARLTFRGMSLLAHAVKGENLPAAQLLIEYGADKDEEGLPGLEAVLREVLACGEGAFGQHLMLEALLGVALRRLEERFRGE